MRAVKFLKQLPAVMIIGVFAFTASPAFSKDKGKSLAKGKTKTTETKGKHGREAGELPFGLDQFTDKKGQLPSGLQKKNDEDGSLTRGLEEGGKELKTTGKAKKTLKK